MGSIAVNGSNIFASTFYIGFDDDGVFLSTNNGGDWTATGLSTSVYSLVLNGIDIFAGASGGVFKSSNNGGNWISTGLSNQTVKSLAISGNNIFAGTYSGVYRSTNYGGNWSASGLSSQTVYSLAVSGNYLFAGTDSGGVYRSTNNGSSWIVVNNGLTSSFILSLSVSGNYLFAGTYDGVFLSTNDGESWLIKNQGFNSATYAYSLLITNDNIFIGTTGQSVWRRSMSDITDVKQLSSSIPSSFSLSQNYPNPFNPVTNLEFGISDLGFVSLKVYDILGKEKFTLVDEELRPGNYKVEFDGSGLTSGVYFYRLTAGEFTETKRMMLIK